MPSGFEPCGLAPVMADGTMPVVTPDGGLVDTVHDVDLHREGTGIVAATVDESGVVAAIHRGRRAWLHAGRRKAMRRRGMEPDWSWKLPAGEFIDLSRELVDGAA